MSPVVRILWRASRLTANRAARLYAIRPAMPPNSGPGVNQNCGADVVGSATIAEVWE